MNIQSKSNKVETPITLSRWLSRSYLRAAIIPLLLIEVSFLIIYWVSGNFTYERNVATVQNVSRTYLTDIANREAMTIQSTLGGIETMARFFALDTGQALATPFDPGAAEKARHAFGPDGVFYSRYGKDQTASYYSGFVPVGPEQKEKVWRTAHLDPTMRNIASSSPLIRQVYLNTWDSYNRIYPYIDVLKQYPTKMDIPSFNFYYEADIQHNPAKKAVWTDAYVDPAGGGWMVSAIAPVYSAKRMEAVVGIDVTVDTIIRHILTIDLPWNGYAILVGRDGTILALPRAGEHDMGLRELKDHSYGEAIQTNTFKPERFNISRRPELKALAGAIISGESRITQVTLNGKPMLAANSLIAGPGWNLVVLAPEKAILAEATSLRDQLRQVVVAMIAILLVFYAGFFFYLAFSARVMSRRVAAPLTTIEGVMDRIGTGEYQQVAPRFGVAELDNVSDHLVAMGRKLGDAYRHIVEQEDKLRTALDSEKRITTGQRRFISILSHEFRTPLTVIDSCGQILRRRAARLTEETALERSDMIRRATARIEDVMKSALQLTQLEDGEVSPRLASLGLSSLLRDAVLAGGQARPEIAIHTGHDAGDAMIKADATLMRTALSALIENACKYSRPDGTVQIAVVTDAQECRIEIRDTGIGIAAEDLPLVRERFFRGSNTTAVPGAGTGLYLASTLIEAQGGQLEICSELDVGTTVTVRVPRAEGQCANLVEAA